MSKICKDGYLTQAGNCRLFRGRCVGYDGRCDSLVDVKPNPWIVATLEDIIDETYDKQEDTDEG